ncbi:MAG: hypothetical protein QOI59_4202 [Gammaproteobacteria bacterium]|nr:hypothetical protein [Gammaproteobacteria bacterium]
MSRALPRYRVDPCRRPDDATALLHVHYRRFNARTGGSVADGRIDIPPRGSATCRFSTHHPSTFTCSAREPELRSCHLYTGCRWADLQISLPASPVGTLRPTVPTASALFDASSVGSLSFTFSALTCRPLRADFSAVAHHHGLLNRSGTAWFEASFCTPAPRGPPSSPPAALGSRSFGLPFTSHQRVALHPDHLFLHLFRELISSLDSLCLRHTETGNYP